MKAHVVDLRVCHGAVSRLMQGEECLLEARGLNRTQAHAHLRELRREQRLSPTASPNRRGIQTGTKPKIILLTISTISELTTVASSE